MLNMAIDVYNYIDLNTHILYAIYTFTYVNAVVKSLHCYQNLIY